MELTVESITTTARLLGIPIIIGMIVNNEVVGGGFGSAKEQGAILDHVNKHFLLSLKEALHADRLHTKT